MEIQVTKRMNWNLIQDEATGESWYVPTDDYTPNLGTSIETHKGFGVRESAPGYLDCTEWEVFDTLKEAKARMAELDAEYEEF
jgi:hypothetical protein